MKNDLKLLYAATVFLFYSLLLALVLGCAHEKIEIKDYVFYGDKGKFGATAVRSLNQSIPGVRVSKEEWDQLRIGMVCTDASNVADMQAAIDKLCAHNKLICAYVREDVIQFKKALTHIEEAAK